MTESHDAILTTVQMGQADRYAIAQGRPGSRLMDAAGQGLVDAITRRYAPRPTAVLCGPGNNGGDGWETAARLQALCWPIRVFSLVERQALKGDAAQAAAKWTGIVEPLEACAPSEFGLIVDALFGAGLTRPLEGEAARLAEHSKGNSVIVSADVPSGIDGDRAQAEGPAFKADLTVTFHRLKPAHLLQPARAQCGEIVLVDIGIPDGWQDAALACGQVNHPGLWPLAQTMPDAGAHKHSRGRLAVLSGPAGATGAARLSAKAGLMAGAGFVTLLTTPGQLHDVSLAEPSIVTRRYDPAAPFVDALNETRAGAAVLGPGAGVTQRLENQVLSALGQGVALVLDADALSVFEPAPEALFTALHPGVVLTPHGGEFARLFSDLSADPALNKMEQTRQAAKRAGCTVLFKGADTVIAEPGGAVRVNVHASPILATAGTGDVLAGLIGALLSQGLTPFDAASAAAWIHGEAGRRCGLGSTVLTVLDRLPAALAHTHTLHHRAAAQQRVYVAGG